MAATTGATQASSDLDSADYNPIDHLNTIFSHPSTLSSAPKVLSTLEVHQSALARNIDHAASAQAASDASSVARMRAAQTELQEMFSKIDAVGKRALQTEQTITTMTADIKRLDNTKKNLTLSMTALKRLQMLTTAYEQLNGLVKTRQYRDVAQLLQAVIQLMAHFKSYRSVDQIAVLGRKVGDTQRELLEQVCEDFELALARGEVSQRRQMLKEACEVLDALGENARARVVTWYTNTTLREYRQIFRGNDEAGSLDNISRRYAWFIRILKTYDVEHAPIFPSHWRVNEILANAFCEGTRDDFKEILQRSMRRDEGQTGGVNVDLLLSCLTQTLEFEQTLEKRFASEPRPSSDTQSSLEDHRPRTFSQAISKAFEPYVSLWVEAQDRHISTLIPKYRSQPLRSADEEEFSPSAVHPSSTELFNTYRLNLNQCAKLSTGPRLLELSQTFGKYLDAYANQVLFHFLSASASSSYEDIITILNTADYCALTCTQLEEKIKSRIDAALSDRVDLESQSDAFLGVCGAAVRALARTVETACEPALREMRNTAWSRLENVGDQSPYTLELTRVIRERSTSILRLLPKPQYQRAFCDTLVDALTTLYLATLAASRPISEPGAEQLLLDSYALKQLFLDLPSLAGAAAPTATAAAAYSTRVTHATAKLDALLKTLQVRSVPAEALVQAYLIHIADASEANFRKLLDLKGLSRRQDQASLVELFHAHKAGQQHAALPASVGWLAALQLQPGAPTAVPSAQAATAGLGLGASAFGNALLSAAKEGVDRIGSAGVSEAPTRVVSPAVGAQGVNEGLRNIGRFFRRDTGAR